MRFSLIVVLASALILAGVILAGGIVVRLCQEVQCISRSTADVKPAEEAGQPAAEGATGATPTPTLVPALVGAMSLATPGAGMQDDLSFGAAAASAAPAADGVPAADDATPDPCPPTPADGLPAGTALRAIGIVRLYAAPDTLAEVLGDYGAGAQFVVVADESGMTAVTRCDVLWYLVGDDQAVVGWVLAAALDDMPPLITPVPTVWLCPQNGCVSCGCAPSCGQPCTQPCYQPSYQPCGVPCNNYPSYPCSHPGI